MVTQKEIARQCVVADSWTEKERINAEDTEHTEFAEKRGTGLKTRHYNNRREMVLLGWGGRLGRRGRLDGSFGGTEESDLCAHVFRGEGNDADLVAALAHESDVIVGNVRVAEGLGQVLRSTVLTNEFGAQVLEIPLDDVLSRRIRVLGAGDDLRLIVILGKARGLGTRKHQGSLRVNG